MLVAFMLGAYLQEALALQEVTPPWGRRFLYSRPPITNSSSWTQSTEDGGSKAKTLSKPSQARRLAARSFWPRAVRMPSTVNRRGGSL